MRVRLCRKEDMESTNRICNAGWEKFYPEYLPQETVDEMVQRRRQDPHKFKPSTKKEFRLVAEDRGKITGFSYCKENKIIAIYIDPNWTGKGAGSMLMHKALERIKANGFKKAVVCTLRENKDALRFYKKHGFVVVGEGYYEHFGVKMPVTNMELVF